MGREVYTSNDQLGGASVMGPNGISHLLVDSHAGAVGAALRWLSYIPRSRGCCLPVVSQDVREGEREGETRKKKAVG